MLKKIAYVVTGVMLLLSSANAEIVTQCHKSESGLTQCNAHESGVNVMNLDCTHGGNGSTSCIGNYTDKVAAKLGFNCTQDKKGNTSCQGKSSDGTSFVMSCSMPKSNNKLLCDIKDNQNESMTLACLISESGVPDCSAVDNDGTKYQIKCNGNPSESGSCVTE